MRKQPQQQRSRAMVERILAAAVRVLRTDGYAALTTNRVAREAGVSPGSLYQYFPDRAAVVDEVVGRWSRTMSTLVTQALAEHVGEQGEAMVRTVVGALVDVLSADAALLRVVLVELPAGPTRPQLLALEQQVRDLLVAYLAGRDPETPPAEHAVRAWAQVLTVEQLVVRWVLDAPGFGAERLVDEVVALVGAAPGRP